MGLGHHIQGAPMSAPRAARSCLGFWAVAIGIGGALFLVYLVVEALAHARGWY